MVKRTLPGMPIPAWESQQSKRMKGKIVGIVQITHSVKTEMCMSSPWATGPVCNVIARAAWLPTWVVSTGGQGVHPIKGENGIVEQVRLQARAAQVYETQGSQLHPETDETAKRTRRNNRSVGVPHLVDPSHERRKSSAKPCFVAHVMLRLAVFQSCLRK